MNINLPSSYEYKNLIIHQSPILGISCAINKDNSIEETFIITKTHKILCGKYSNSYISKSELMEIPSNWNMIQVVINPVELPIPQDYFITSINDSIDEIEFLSRVEKAWNYQLWK